MYTVSEVVEIDKAQNLILPVPVKNCIGSDDILPEMFLPEADFDE